jgi:RES domain-containing protein
MLEYFVHIDIADPPKDLVWVEADIPSGVSRLVLSPDRLPASWRQSPALSELAAIGDAFARERRAGVLIVPSAITPAETNLLINPRHPDFTKIRIHKSERLDYDTRFLLRS